MLADLLAKFLVDIVTTRTKLSNICKVLQENVYLAATRAVTVNIKRHQVGQLPHAKVNI